MMTKVNHTGKVYHMRAKRQMAQSLGQIAKFKRRYEQGAEESKDKQDDVGNRDIAPVTLVLLTAKFSTNKEL